MTQPTSRQRRAVVGVVGFSGIGKTTLLERLIPVLASQGVRVGAVKHASHGFLADRPGKDSHRLYEAGADAVALVSREQLATFARVETGTERDVSLPDALAGLPGDLDVILVEGFSWEAIPRIVLVAEGGTPAREHLERGEVLEIVEVPARIPGRPPVFPDPLIDSLSRVVLERRHAGSGGARGAHGSSAGAVRVS